MEDQRIQLTVVSESPKLRERILAHADPFYFDVVERGALEELPTSSEGDARPSIVVIAEADETSGPTAVAIGVQDMVRLESLTSIRLRDVAMASLGKERRLQELKRERSRAIIQNELAGGFATAQSGLEILEILADGLIALGATSVSCWQSQSNTLELVVARGTGEHEPTDALEQVLERNETMVHRGEGVEFHVPLVGDSGARWVVRAALEGSPAESRVIGLEQVVRHAAEALERVRLRRDLAAEQVRMAVLLDAVRQHPDQLEVGELLEDAGPRIEQSELDVEALDLRVLLGSAGFEPDDGVEVELQADPRLLGRALRTLRRTQGPKTATVHADDHAAYVELRGMRDEATKMHDDPGLALVERVCHVHGGQAWLEGREGERRICLQLPKVPRPFAPQFGGFDGDPTAPILDDDHFGGLRDAFRSPKLGVLLDLWAKARRGGPLPHPARVRGANVLTLRPDIAEARVSYGPRNEPTFTWTMLGARIERRLGGTLIGRGVQKGPGGSFLQDLLSQYRRCTREARPSYDYVRQRGASGWSFERLLLPCSRDASRRVADVIALVLFDGV